MSAASSPSFLDPAAAADVGNGGDGRGLTFCDKCCGEGVLVSLTKKQKRARRLERMGPPGPPGPPRGNDADGTHQQGGGEGATTGEDAEGQRGGRPGPTAAATASAPPPRSRAQSPPPPPLKVLPCKCCQGTGLVPTADGELPTPYPNAPTVAIVGAGIGGAALALALQQRGVKVQLYERDASFAARKQGYGLTMQKYSGGTALSHLGRVGFPVADNQYGPCYQSPTPGSDNPSRAYGIQHQLMTASMVHVTNLTPPGVMANPMQRARAGGRGVQRQRLPCGGRARAGQVGLYTPGCQSG
jgi:hypothetical protein